MAKAELQIKGIEALKERLKKREEVFKNALGVQLMQLGEAVVTHAKQNKGYKDRTANLKNSISYALFKDGELLEQHIGNIPKPDEDAGGQAQVADNLSRYATQEGVVKPQGYTLIVVAGMNYGKYVEDKGYNVLYLTQNYLREELKKVINGIINDIVGKK